jgi:transposase
MSMSLLYHAFGLREVEYRSTRYKGNTIIFSAVMINQGHKCPECEHRWAKKKGRKTRLFRMGLIGRKHCILNLELHRLECCNCGKLWWPKLCFMVGNHRYTTSFALTALDLLRFGTVQAVAHLLDVGWDLVKEIHKLKLRGLYRKISLNEVKYIGIDEFSIKKGHNYITIFTDLSTGRILHAVEGKGKEDILPFMKKLAIKAKNLKAIAMDMSSTFFWSVREVLPHVDVVFDHYHVSALMNRAMDDLRREYQRQLEEEGKQALKGSRFLLLRNYDTLDPEKKDRLDELLEINRPLYLIHSMKEQLRLFWNHTDERKARRFLAIWCRDAWHSGIKQLADVAKTLASYRTGLLTYFKHRITSGAVEGIVNKIKTLKRQAYGFRDMEYFKLRLYHLHTQRYALTG